VVFDLLDSAGKDVRREPLLDRKHELRRIIGSSLPPIIYADFLATHHLRIVAVAYLETSCLLRVVWGVLVLRLDFRQWLRELMAKRG